MFPRHHTFSSGAATAAIAALLVLAPAAFAAEPEVEALQKEIDGLRAEVALLERHVTQIEDHLGTPAMLHAAEDKGDIAGAIERFDLLKTQPEQPERRLFGNL